MFRQGDVLVIPISDEEGKQGVKDNEKVDLDGGRVVLAYGEATGHAHAVPGNHAELFGVDEGLRFLKVNQISALTHEEHDKIPLEKGYYKIVRQREYTAKAPRFVAD